MTAEREVGRTGKRVLARVVFWLFVVISVATPFWVRLTPLRSIPLLGFLIVFLGWFIYAGVRRSKRGVIGLGAGFAVFVAFGLITGLLLAPLQTPTFSSSPVELSKIIDLSRFRSCAGHDFSAKYVDDAGTKETDRSMKHYVTLSDTYGGGVEVPVLAVTDGVIAGSKGTDPNGHLGNAGDFNDEVTLLADTSPLFGNWNIRYQHVHATRKQGDRVQAGDVIATVPPKDWAQVIEKETGTPALNANQPVSFDVAVEYEPLFPTGVRNESYVKLLSSSLRDAYANAGYTLDGVITSKAARDADPCNGQYNVDPVGDWVNGDRVRQAADAAIRSSSGTSGSGSSSTSGSSGSSTSGATSANSRPDCTAANIGQIFNDSSGAWKCMKSAEGNLTWGPATG